MGCKKSTVGGFTIIELLVVIAVAAILFLAGFTAFRSFDQRRTLDNSYKELRNNLNFARQLATSGSKPSSCVSAGTTLGGYELVFSSSTSYRIYAVCNSAQVDVGRVYNLSAGVSFSANPAKVFFSVLARGATISGNSTVTLSAGGRTVNATVDSEGNLNRQ